MIFSDTRASFLSCANIFLMALPEKMQHKLIGNNGILEDTEYGKIRSRYI